ncbi:MAG: hypothetical protein ABIZ04_13620 [Opitutus sp.]
MNSFLRGALIFSVFALSSGWGAESTVTVASSRELKLAVVDPSKATAARDASHAAFAASLSQAVSKEGGGDVGVRVKCVAPDSAAFSLSTGVYDAVLVLSGSLPRALMTSDVLRVSATLGAGKTEKKVFLVFNSGDETLAKLLLTSFPTALTNDKFLDAVDGISSRIAAAGEGAKVAAVTP